MGREDILIKLYLDLMKKALTASIYEESAYTMVESRRPPAKTLSHPLQFVRGLSKYLLVRALQDRSILLVRGNSFDASQREEGKDWPFFGFTMTGHKRLENVQMCVEDVLRNQVPGDLIETGAWRGGTTILMRALLKAYGDTDRKVWVADSFEGLPAPKSKDDGWDLSQVGYLKVSLDKVKANFARFNLLDEQVEFLEGWFSDTLPRARIESIAVLRLDGDMYSSTMEALRNLYHKVSKGGYVIIDDYSSWPSCRRAVTEFLREHSIEPDIRQIDWTGVYWKLE